ncbi:MAG: M48 family metallopeptidase [Cyclobacteriaceae bacterium]|nr:M48 family metallopeptidase [Cyclobacteriaceae bacterium]
MSEKTIVVLVLGILIFDFLLDLLLSFLNEKSSKKPIPEELNGVYDDEKYQKSQDYQNTTGRFSKISGALSLFVMIVAIGFGWFGLLDDWARSSSPLAPVTPLIFFGVLFVISDVMGIPFSLYQNFVIEARFGFNKMTFKTFFADKAKEYLLAVLLGGGLLIVFVLMVEVIGADFWWYFWIIITIFLLVLNMLYTSLLLPLFNKLVPLEEGELKKSIADFAEKVSFPLTQVFVIDGSKRSSKGNAFFSGLGRKKKVVLYDTLIAKHSVDELTAVFAHEVGHYKKNHIYIGTFMSIVQTGLMLFLLSKMILNTEVSFAMGGEVTAIHLNMLAFGILYSPVSRILRIIMNLISRKHEYEADAYAATYFAAQPLIDGLKKMSGDHLTNLTPHSANVFINYSHPTVLQRIRAMNLLK